jgi:hypothetical protein
MTYPHKLPGRISGIEQGIERMLFAREELRDLDLSFMYDVPYLHPDLSLPVLQSNRRRKVSSSPIHERGSFATTRYHSLPLKRPYVSSGLPAITPFYPCSPCNHVPRYSNAATPRSKLKPARGWAGSLANQPPSDSLHQHHLQFSILNSQSSWGKTITIDSLLSPSAYQGTLLKMASAYTPSQIQQYEEYVSLPSRFRQASKPALDAEYLTALHIHQISSVPYENLVLHYSTTHAVSLDPQVLFKKIVADARGRGGYCMENGIFFHHVLRALGFTVYLTGVRIRPRVGGVPGGDYTGW